MLTSFCTIYVYCIKVGGGDITQTHLFLIKKSHGYVRLSYIKIVLFSFAEMLTNLAAGRQLNLKSLKLAFYKKNFLSFLHSSFIFKAILGNA